MPGRNRPLTEASRRRNSLGGGPDSLRAAGHSVEAFDPLTANIDCSYILYRSTIDTYSYPHGPSESKIERRSETEAPRAFAPASRSGKHPAYRQLCAPFFFTGVRSKWHHLAAIQRPAHPARRRPGGASDTGHRREDDRTGTGYNPPAGSPRGQEVRAPGTPFR